MMHVVINHLRLRDPVTDATVKAADAGMRMVVDAGALAARVAKVDETHLILILEFRTAEDAGRIAREVGGPWMNAHIRPLLAGRPSEAWRKSSRPQKPEAATRRKQPNLKPPSHPRPPPRAPNTANSHPQRRRERAPRRRPQSAEHKRFAARDDEAAPADPAEGRHRTPHPNPHRGPDCAPDRHTP